MTSVGRPKEYRNAAEKQRAYRERRKAQKQQLDAAQMLIELVNRKIVTLRKSVHLWRKEGKAIYIDTNPRVRVHRIKVGNFIRNVIEDTVFQYMLASGYIILTDNRHGDEIYDFTDLFDALEMD